MNRRDFLGGLLAALTAPAIIRTPGLLMPVHPLIVPTMRNGLIGVNSIEGYDYSLELADILRTAIRPLTQFRDPWVRRWPPIEDWA